MYVYNVITNPWSARRLFNTALAKSSPGRPFKGSYLQLSGRWIDNVLKVIYHPLYGMNNYVLIWGDWLSCDPLRGSHDNQLPHIRKHVCPILWQLWFYLSQIYLYYIRGDRSALTLVLMTYSLPFGIYLKLQMVRTCIFNHLNPHDALKHNFASLKKWLTVLKSGGFSTTFSWNCSIVHFHGTYFKSSSSTTGRELRQ